MVFTNRSAVGLALCLLLAVQHTVNAVVPSDEIVALPGWTGKLPSRQFSGYVTLDSGGERRMHYWLVESESDPQSDPLVLWVQGGPGCSSLLGFFTEMGPFGVRENESKDGVHLVRNEYAWNKIANVLFWESPIGVGYSYTSDAKDYATNDTRTAVENLQFLRQFFKLYPEYRSREFFIAGESYAGIYIPMLAHLVLDHNKVATHEDQIPLKGLMVGNGCTGNRVGACSDAYDLTIALPYFKDHGLFSNRAHAKLAAACGSQTVPTTQECRAAVNACYNEIGDINIYDIYGTCILNKTNVIGLGIGRRSPRVRRPDGVGGPPECEIGPLAQVYMRQAAVAAATHVDMAKELSPWSACSDALHAQYGETVDNLLPGYPTILRAYRTLIFNGDADGRIPFTDNEKWTESMNFEIDKPWHAWMVDGQVSFIILQLV